MELKSADQWKELLASVDNFVFDCDGVLWLGTGEAIPGAQEVIKLLRKKGKSIYFVSNNSGKSRKQYLVNFDRLGFEAYENEIYSVGYATAHYLKHVLNFKKKVYLMGLSGLAQELDLQGIPHIGVGPDPMVGGPAELAKITLDPEVGAVVVGFDKEFNWMKLIKACSYLHKPDCLFIATNEDANLPIKSDTIVSPGTGCIVKSVKVGSGREPIVVGKPHSPIFEVLQKSVNLDPSRTVMIGDRLNTDMELGIRNGMKTLLVFSGISQRKDLEDQSETKPDFFSESVAGLLACKETVSE
ncbi:glycerol-3-phosphate phosphatase-like [Halichondria panicea]|uniref:glycerol-3-phosphate phosphatase-like n=1 Tax=Halichondria panicea TaxID=6063 RepID=UPI00312B4DDA